MSGNQTLRMVFRFLNISKDYDEQASVPWAGNIRPE